jgi:hypothetical protein
MVSVWPEPTFGKNVGQNAGVCDGPGVFAPITSETPQNWRLAVSDASSLV